MKTSLFITIFLSLNALALPDSREVIRQGCRQSIMKMAAGNGMKGIESPILEEDRAEDLVDEPHKMLRNVQKMDQMNLRSAQTKNIPWSDSYWPLYRGGLGQRYNDPDFTGYDWKESFDYITTQSASKMLGQRQTNLLSPSEKYDALMSLEKFPLTASSWQDGNEFFRYHGKVESWMGLCHGWAAASIMMPEPRKKVQINSNNFEMTFHPSDVKGLATLLWAKGQFRTRFIGGRCNEENPSRDRSGRVNQEECLDNNPGTFHLAIVNQVGLSRRPFVMDASFDYEVWNHPVFAYDYTYYNPITKKPVSKMDSALVKVAEWRTDPRAKLRSKDARFLLGVKMKVVYAVENDPSDEEDQESLSSEIDYEYDLELNERMEIVGGEWYSESHPDFLWVPATGSFPMNAGPQSAGPANLENISSEMRKVSNRLAEQGMPLGVVVKELVKKSSRL